MGYAPDSLLQTFGFGDWPGYEQWSVLTLKGLAFGVIWYAGISDMKNKYIPEKCVSFDPKKDWMSISGGQHHTLALDGSG